jgi:hypothetical protein
MPYDDDIFSESTDAVRKRWSDESRRSDPIFASKETRLTLRRALGRGIQSSRCAHPHTLPLYAQLFDLERFIPTPALYFDTGHECVGGCQLHTKCFPAFMYT